MTLDREDLDSETWLEATSRRLEFQTDKAKVKVVPCTVGGCEVDIVVNTFYAPAKALCAEHGGENKSQVKASHLTKVTDESTVQANGALAKLLCPICQKPMVVVAINEIGHITFKCTDGIYHAKDHPNDAAKISEYFCLTSVTVRPKWSFMEMVKIPSAFTELVDDFNIEQKIKAFDQEEADRDFELQPTQEPDEPTTNSSATTEPDA